MEARVHELKLLDRTNANTFGAWSTITGLTASWNGMIVVTTTGWRSPGLPFIDMVSLDPNDRVEWAPGAILATLVDLVGPDVEAAA